jgi:hypothetical protein
MKNRMRETCTSGTVRDEDGNILIYSAGSVIRSRCQATAKLLRSKAVVVSVAETSGQ